MSKEIAIDWSLLPPDLLSKIAGTLDQIADRLRFAVVCKSWRSASKSTPNLPWLLLPDDPLRDYEARAFFSLSDDNVYTLHLPQIRKKLVYCSAHGWLLAVDRCSFKQTASLLNPLTKATILLPPLPFEENLMVKFGRCKLIFRFQTLVVMLSLDTGPIICCRKPKGAKNFVGWGWTEICAVESSDFTYYKDRCFVLNERYSQTLIIDPKTTQVDFVIPSVGTDRPFHYEDKFSSVRRRYLVVSSSGEKLFLLIAPSRTGKERFEVFELHQTEHWTEWVKVRSIGHDTFFVDADHAIAVPTSEFNRWGENCIIFLDYTYKGRDDRVKVTRLGLYDIGNDGFEILSCCWHDDLEGRKSQGWFVPIL